MNPNFIVFRKMFSVHFLYSRVKSLPVRVGERVIMFWHSVGCQPLWPLDFLVEPTLLFFYHVIFTLNLRNKKLQLSDHYTMWSPIPKPLVECNIVTQYGFMESIYRTKFIVSIMNYLWYTQVFCILDLSLIFCLSAWQLSGSYACVIKYSY